MPAKPAFGVYSKAPSAPMLIVPLAAAPWLSTEKGSPSPSLSFDSTPAPAATVRVLPECTE